MVHVLVKILISGLAVFATSYILPGATVDSFLIAIVVAIILGVMNAIVRPVLLFLTLPINILTFGLFTFVINAILILTVSAIVPGFAIGGFLSAIFFSLILSIVNYVLNSFTE